jgi:hypothetical protein
MVNRLHCFPNRESALLGTKSCLSELPEKDADAIGSLTRKPRALLTSAGLIDVCLHGGNGLSVRSDDLDSVLELYTHDDLGQLVVSTQAVPACLSRLCELERHGKRGLVREAAFRSRCPMSNVLSIGLVVRKCFQCSAGKS